MDIRRFAIALLCASLAACATPNVPKSQYKAIAPDAMTAIDNGHYVLKAAPTPDFVQVTGADQATMTVGVLFGAVGGVAGVAVARAHSRARGRALVAGDAIPDPMTQLVDRIRPLLAAKYGESSNDSDYEFDLAIDNWAMHDKNVLLFVSADLVDMRTKRKLASSHCRYSNKDTAAGETADRLLENRAEKLKLEIEKGVDFCAAAFDREMFASKH